VPLTESQLEIWLAAQLGDEASCAFNESVSLGLRGALNAAALQSAMNRVVAATMPCARASAPPARRCG